MFQLVLQAAILALLIAAGLACDGCHSVVIKTRACAKQSYKNTVVLPSAINATLTPQCLVYPSGCVQIRDNIASTQIDYQFTKGMMKFQKSNVNLCEMMENDEAKLLLGTMGFPESCPFTKSKVCGQTNRPGNFSKFERFMKLGNKAQIILNMDHGPVGKSCFNMQLNFECGHKGF